MLAGRLVEETVVPAGHDVTVGTRAGCTSVLPGPGLPLRWRLFRWRRGRYWFNPLPRMQVRLADEKSPTGAMPLGDRARGKGTLGELTVLFQMVPPPRHLPRLPAGLRGSLGDRMDGVFAAFVVASLVLHATLVLHLRRVDWPRQPLADEVSADFPRLVRRALPPPKPIKAVASNEPSVASTPTPHRKPAPTLTTTDRRPTLREQVRHMGVLGILTAKGEEPGGIVDVLARGNVDQQAEEAFRGIAGVTVATADPRLLMHTGEGTGRVAETKTLDIRGAHIAEADTGVHHERRISVHTGALDLDSTSTGQLDPALLARTVKERAGALRACYERALRRAPTLQGKLVLHMSITAAGTVSAADVDGESLQDVEMSECIRASVLRWRFPAPEGGRLEVSFPFVFQAAE